MSRRPTRPDTSKRKSPITPQGFKKLQEEADHLWRVERPKITEEVFQAAALGDRSENAGYIYGKKRLREIDRRLRFLGNRLDNVTVVREAPKDQERVYFGAWVTFEDEEGVEKTYRLVGPDELDLERGFISIDSPLGKGLLGKRLDDDVMIRRPKGSMEITITAIRYAPDA